MTLKKSILKVLLWTALALAFNAVIFFVSGPVRAMEFFGGYVIELSLSLDNLFLFLVLFASFGVESKYQPRVLNWGILAVIVLRFLFIFAGIGIVNMFHWVLYVFGIILLFTGFKLLIKKEEEETDHKNSKIMTIMKKIIPVTDTVESDRFFIRKNGILFATPLFAVLIVMNLLDIVFAMDSIPAIFAVTTDTVIVYTSNLFAVMGLRSLYFVLERLSSLFRFLKQGVATILIFTGVKLAILFFHIEIPVVLSVSIIFGILLISILASVLYNRLSVPETKEESGEEVA